MPKYIKMFTFCCYNIRNGRLFPSKTIKKTGESRVFKMKKAKLRILSLILASLILMSAISLMACEGGNTPGNTDDSTEPPETTAEPAQPLEIIKDGQLNYKIIVPARADDSVLALAALLTNNIKKWYGIECSYGFDAMTPTSDDACEILIGDTDRPESAEAIEGLRSRDYAMMIYGKKLVLNGPNSTMVERAVNAFVDFILLAQYAAGSHDVIMQPTEAQRGLSNYKIKECNILGVSIKDYTIVYQSDLFSAKRLAIRLAAHISDCTGYELPVVSDKTDAAAHEILIGNTSRGGVKLRGAALGAYSATVSGSSLCFGAENLFGYMNLYNYLKDELFVGERLDISADYTAAGEGSPEEEATLSVEQQGEYRVMFFNILGNCDTALYPTAQRNQTAAEALIAMAPDAFGLQECSPNSRGSDSIVRTLYLAGYVEVPVTANNSNSTNYTPLFYKKNKFNVVECGYHLYDDGQKDKSKSITWGVLEDKATGRRFAVCSTHYSYKSEASAARMKDSEQLIAVNDQIKQKYNCPIISGGDLNCKTPTSEYKALLTAGLLDMQKLATVTEDSNTTHTYPEYDTKAGLYLKLYRPSKSYVDAIDHALLYNGDGVRVNRFEILTLEYTLLSADHCPLLVDFDIN